MAIDEKKLKPCPHCGGSASISVDYEAVRDTKGRLWAYTAVCDHCCATSGLCYSKEMATESWNKRAELSLENKTSDKDVPDNNVEKMNREFEELEVTYDHDDLCTYPEYMGKPYFEIKYKENGIHFVGYGTYNPEVLSKYLRDYFMPLAMPKESKWIPVTERLPEENGRYIVTLFSRYNNRYESFDLWYEDGSWYECNYLIMDKIIAWMPLPPAYDGAE